MQLIIQHKGVYHLRLLLREINLIIHQNIKEQKKIASFLSKVDEKIEKLEKKQEIWEIL